jgi:hypothetical protein
MNNNYLTPIEINKGPDILRPGSCTSRYGSGRFAFIYTRYADDDGRQLFVEPASTGHEVMITRPNVLKALFGPDLDKVLAEVTSYRDENDINGQPTGQKRSFLDHIEIRLRSRDTNLFGRYGTVRGRQVLMLWGRNEGWEQMLIEVVRALEVPNNAILTAGTSELGEVGQFMQQEKHTA